MNSWPIGCQTHLHDSSREAILVFIWVCYVKTNLHKNTANPNSLVWYLVEWMQLRLWNRFFVVLLQAGIFFGFHQLPLPSNLITLNHSEWFFTLKKVDKCLSLTKKGETWLDWTWTFFLELWHAELQKLEEAELVLDRPRTIEAALRNGLPNIIRQPCEDQEPLSWWNHFNQRLHFQPKSNDHEENSLSLILF